MSKTSASNTASAGKKPASSKTSALKATANKAEVEQEKTIKESSKTKTESIKATAKSEEKTARPAPLNEQAIATSAYLLWEEEGYQHGRHEEYWLRAEEELKKQLMGCSK